MTAREIFLKQGVTKSPVSGLESYLKANAINAMEEFAKLKCQELLLLVAEKAEIGMKKK